jgi:hypothetical protein
MLPPEIHAKTYQPYTSHCSKKQVTCSYRANTRYLHLFPVQIPLFISNALPKIVTKNIQIEPKILGMAIEITMKQPNQ